jgi:hypothetical protein
MRNKIKNNYLTIIGLGVGVIGGFLYWKFVGCSSGTCPLTSSWKIMLVYGGIMGSLLGNMIQEFVKKPVSKV